MALMAAVEQAVTPPAIYLASTTPFSPLLTQCNELVELFDGSRSAVEAMCQRIAGARQELLLQFYEWDDDDASGQQVNEALRMRIMQAWNAPLGRPLLIRILINKTWPEEHRPHWASLEALVESVGAHPASEGRVHMEVATYGGAALSVLHSKSMLVDRKEALLFTGNLRTLGGLDTDNYNMGAALRGPVVRVLRDDWWTARSRSRLRRQAPYLSGPSTGQEDEQSNELEPRPVCEIGEPLLGAAVLARQSQWNFRNRGDANPQNRGVLALIKAADQQIDILNPILNVRPIMDALVEAILDRGVRVNLLVSLNMDRWAQHMFMGGDNAESAYALYQALLKAGGEAAANRLDIRFASAGTGFPAPPNTSANVHAKAASFDHNALLIGSMNLDWQSWNNSRELNVALFGASAVKHWQDKIYSRLFRLGSPIRPDDLPNRRRRRTDPVFKYLVQRAAKRTPRTWSLDDARPPTYAFAHAPQKQ